MKSVAILICTYRGEKHLRAQLDTIEQQTHTNWRIYASDDGSDDATPAILSQYAERLGSARLQVFDGPRRGFAANFFSLIERAEIAADFYAFTDQDDEWDTRKLERAVSALSALPGDVPALYGSRSELIDESGRHMGYSRVFTRPSGFRNALVQNMVSGNTMVLDASAMALIRRAGSDIQVSAHDWWAYLLITGCGGVMLYDRYPTIRYRQHGRNLYGSNISLRAKRVRVAKLFAGDFEKWNALNVAALRKSWRLLTEDNRKHVEFFEGARRGSSLQRLLYLLRSRVYRQTWDGQLALVIAALAKRI